MPEYEDKTIVCGDCHKEFVWTAGEQEWYADNQLTFPPKRCKSCREVRKAQGVRIDNIT